MAPILADFDIFGMHIIIYAYPTFLILAILSAGLLLPIRLRKIGLTKKQAVLLVGSLGILTLIGGRLLYAVIYLKEILRAPENLWKLSFSGFTLYGGLIFSFIGLILLCKKWKCYLLSVMDAATPVLAISLILSRMGCLLNGCCFGKLTHVPWGIKVTKGSLAYIAQIQKNPFSFFGGTYHVHPTQIYEMLVVLFALALAYYIYIIKTHRMAGFLALPFGLFLSIGRLIVFYFRDFSAASLIGNSIRGPVVYGICSLVCLMWMLKQWKVYKHYNYIELEKK